MVESKITTARLPNEIIKNLKEIAEKEKLDTSSVIRRLLAKAIEEWRIDYALEQYKKGEFSFGQLAKFAEISVWDIPLLLKGKRVHLNYDLEEFEKELKNIEWKKR